MTATTRVRALHGGAPDRPPGLNDRVAQVAQTFLLLVGLAVFVGIVVLARGASIAERPLFSAGASVPELNATKAAGAVLLEAALAKGGSGIRFEIVQYQTMKARPGGKRIEIPHPVDRQKTIGLTDEYFLSSLEERGLATAAGFWSEMRAGPAPDAEPDWTADLLFEALETAGKTWRNDGRGWYATATPPGIGLDPVTVQRLPGLLRNSTSPIAGPSERVGATALSAMTIVGQVADIPGIVAADGAKFTKAIGPMTLAFDSTGRIAKVQVSALNTNMIDFDLVVDTTILIFYDDIGSLPEPKPIFSGDVEVLR